MEIKLQLIPRNRAVKKLPTLQYSATTKNKFNIRISGLWSFISPDLFDRMSSVWYSKVKILKRSKIFLKTLEFRSSPPMKTTTTLFVYKKNERIYSRMAISFLL